MKFRVSIGLLFVLICLIVIESDAKNIDRRLNKRRNGKYAKTSPRVLTRKQHKRLNICKGKGCRQTTSINIVSGKNGLVLDNEKGQSQKQRKRPDRRPKKHKNLRKTPVVDRTISEEVVDIHEYIPVKKLKHKNKKSRQDDEQDTQLKPERGEVTLKKNRKNIKRQHNKPQKTAKNKTSKTKKAGSRSQKFDLKEEPLSDSSNAEKHRKTNLSLQDGKKVSKRRRKPKSVAKIKNLKGRFEDIVLKKKPKSERKKDRKQSKTEISLQDQTKDQKQRNKEKSTTKSRNKNLKRKFRNIVLKKKSKLSKKKDRKLLKSEVSEQDEKTDQKQRNTKSESNRKNYRKKSKTEASLKDETIDQKQLNKKSESNKKNDRKKSKTETKFKDEKTDQKELNKKSASNKKKHRKKSKTEAKLKDEKTDQKGRNKKFESNKKNNKKKSKTKVNLLDEKAEKKQRNIKSESSKKKDKKQSKTEINLQDQNTDQTQRNKPNSKGTLQNIILKVKPKMSKRKDRKELKTGVSVQEDNNDQKQHNRRKTEISKKRDRKQSKTEKSLRDEKTDQKQRKEKSESSEKKGRKQSKTKVNLQNEKSENKQQNKNSKSKKKKDRKQQKTELSLQDEKTDKKQKNKQKSTTKSDTENLKGKSRNIILKSKLHKTEDGEDSKTNMSLKYTFRNKKNNKTKSAKRRKNSQRQRKHNSSEKRKTIDKLLSLSFQSDQDTVHSDEEEVRIQSKSQTKSKKITKKSNVHRKNKKSKSQTTTNYEQLDQKQTTNSKQRDQGDPGLAESLISEELRQYNKELKAKKEMMLLIKENRKLERQIARLKKQSSNQEKQSRKRNKIVSRIKGHRRKIQDRKSKVAKLKRKLNKTSGERTRIVKTSRLGSRNSRKRLGKADEILETDESTVNGKNVQGKKSRKGKTQSQKHLTGKQRKGKTSKRTNTNDDETQESPEVEPRKQQAKPRRKSENKQRNVVSGKKQRKTKLNKKGNDNEKSKSTNNDGEKREDEDQERKRKSKKKSQGMTHSKEVQSGTKPQKQHKGSRKSTSGKVRNKQHNKKSKSPSVKTIPLISSESTGISLIDPEPLNNGQGSILKENRKRKENKDDANNIEINENTYENQISTKQKKRKKKGNDNPKRLNKKSSIDSERQQNKKSSKNLNKESNKETMPPKSVVHKKEGKPKNKNKGKGKGSKSKQTIGEDDKDKEKQQSTKSKQDKGNEPLNEELKNSKRKNVKQQASDELNNNKPTKSNTGREKQKKKNNDDKKQRNANKAKGKQGKEINEKLQITENEGIKLPDPTKQTQSQNQTESRKQKRPGKKRPNRNRKTNIKPGPLETSEETETVKLTRQKKKDTKNVSPALTIFDKISYLPTRKPDLHKDIAKDLPYRLRQPQTFLRAPAGVERLEEELRPGVTRPINNIKDSLHNVLKIFQRRVTKISNNYGSVARDAKHDIMAVRSALVDIADANDRAFDVLLDVAGLVRYIYKRAHEHTGPTRSPERMYLHGSRLPSVDFRYRVMMADQSASRANYIYQNTMQWKSRCMDQERRFSNMKEKNSLREPGEELRDLVRNSRRIHKKLRHKIRNDVVGRVHYYKNTLNGLGTNYFVALNLSQTAHEEIKNCMKVTKVENIRLRNKVMKARKSSVQFGNSTMAENLRLPPDDEDGLRMRDLTTATIRSHRHARGLQRVVDYHIGKFLIPAHERGKKFLQKTTSDGTGSMHHVRVIIKRAMRIVKKIDTKMDEIRIFLGNEDVLKQRCEEILRHRLGIEDGDTIIDCEELGFVVEQSGSGSGDEEFISTAKPIVTEKITASPPPESTTAPSVVDGSGSDDFVFAETDGSEKKKDNDEAEEDKGIWGWFSDDPNAMNPALFKNVLGDKAVDARRITEKLNDRAIKTEARRKALNSMWLLKQETYVRTKHYVGNATKMQASWKEAKPFMAGITKKIAEVYRKVKDQEQVLTNKTKKALEIAEKHMNKKTAGTNEEIAADEPMLMSAISAAVNKVKSDTRAILDLHRQIDKPCRVVETTATRLRNNIADLRKKIQQARTITSSIPVVVEMRGKTSIKLPLKDSNKKESVMTSFEMCVKPNGTDMSIFDLKSNDSISYQLSLEDSYPKLSLFNPDQSVIGSMTSSFKLNSDTWHQIFVTRYGHTVQIRAKQSNATEGETIEKTAFPDIRAIQRLPTVGYVGGYRNNEAVGYSGCIGDVTVDGYNLGLAQSPSGTTRQCTSRCFSDTSSSIIFEGNGYVKFPLDVMRPNRRLENIEVRFQTTNKEGTLFLLNNKLKKLQVLISLSNGSIHMESRNKRGTIVLRSKASNYSSGSVHTIKILFRANKVDVTVDDVKDLFEEKKTTQVLTSTIPEGVYLGGWGSKSNIISGKTKLRPLVGCVSYLQINNKMIPMFMQEESENAYLGTCSENIWMRCVRFTDDSTRVTLTDENDKVTQYITVSKDSIGTLLHFNRKKNFNIELSLESDGLTVSEELSGDAEVIPMKFTQQWMTIKLLDYNKEVRVTFNGTSVTFPYKKRGGWLGGYDKVPVYTVAIGGKIGAEEADFWGGISSFVLNDRPVDLRANATEHNLNGCERQTFISPGDFIDSSKTEKPVC